MTPAQQALAEAAAAETARVYGSTCPEYRPSRGPVVAAARPKLRVIHSRRPQPAPTSGQPAA